jgi:hypothetical protein
VIRELFRFVKFRLHLLRRGLPDIEVRYDRRELGPNSIAVSTSFFYAGRVHANIDGRDYWSLNGTFTVEQPVEVSIEVPSLS